jgi:hypothetical protein
MAYSPMARQDRLDARSLHKKYEKCEGRDLDHDGRFGPQVAMGQYVITIVPISI